MGHIVVALVQAWAKVSFPGLVNFVPAVVYKFCLNLPAAFWQAGNVNLAHPCGLVVAR